MDAGRAKAVGRVGIALGVVLATLAIVAPADAQQIVPTPNPGRDCQTVRTCNFSRSAEVRGCLSSYTCRTCRTVKARCDVGGRTNCYRVQCSWGG